MTNSSRDNVRPRFGLDNGEVWCHDPDTDRCGDVQQSTCLEEGGTVVSSCTEVPETEPDTSACGRSF